MDQKLKGLTYYAHFSHTLGNVRLEGVNQFNQVEYRRLFRSVSAMVCHCQDNGINIDLNHCDND